MLVQRLFQSSFGKCTFSTPSTYALKIGQSVEEREYGSNWRSFSAQSPCDTFQATSWNTIARLELATFLEYNSCTARTGDQFWRDERHWGQRVTSQSIKAFANPPKPALIFAPFFLVAVHSSCALCSVAFREQEERKWLEIIQTKW